MKYETILHDDAEQKVEQVGRADILVGIPSYNNERTIGQVTRAVQYGLAKYFPKHKSLIANVDGSSTDRTREIVRQTSVYTDLDPVLVEHQVHPARTLATSYHGLPGKGSAFGAIFEMAVELEVDVCVVVDSDIRSIAPEWIEMLAGPILIKGYDYVAPHYLRHKNDGTITNAIVYPLSRALYGKRVRQPIGGEFGFSRSIAERFLTSNAWGTDVARYGIDIWMTTIAITEGFKICQSFLGSKVHDRKDPSKALGPMFKQVVGTLFYLMSQYAESWKNVNGSSPTALYGFRLEVPPEPVHVRAKPLIEQFRAGVKDTKVCWRSVLPEERVEELEEIASLPSEKFRFPKDTWVRTVYDFALAYRNNSGNAESERETIANTLVSSLVPLYFGRTASFLRETRGMPSYEAEQTIEHLCGRFEEMKPYLLERWFGQVKSNG